MLLNDNIALRPNCFCCRCAYLTAIGIAGLARLILGFLLPFNTVKDIFTLFGSTVTINKDNWWQKKSDPFFTNCSYFTAFLCWIIWFLMVAVMLTIFIILTAELIKVIKSHGFKNCVVTFFKGILKSIPFMLVLYYGFI